MSEGFLSGKSAIAGKLTKSLQILQYVSRILKDTLVYSITQLCVIAIMFVNILFETEVYASTLENDNPRLEHSRLNEL